MLKPLTSRTVTLTVEQQYQLTKWHRAVIPGIELRLLLFLQGQHLDINEERDVTDV